MLTSNKILLFGDEYDSLMLLNFYLQQADYRVLLAWNLSQAADYIQQESPMLVLLDRTHLEAETVETCRSFRQMDNRMCIAVVSNQSSEEMRVKCFEAGIDDFVVKPFNARELVLRVSAMLRRAGGFAIMPVVHSVEKSVSAPAHDMLPRAFDKPGFTIDVQRRQVYKNGREIELTRLEFDLLKFLYDHRGYVLSRDRLLTGVWKYNHTEDERVVDVVMARLRKKLEDDPNQPCHIQTVRGVGYKYVA